uniref:Uncharacterized protein n=1 Tax=Arundo donax TaxID=35708 RepID=A0A0A8Z0S4_ARUDO
MATECLPKNKQNSRTVGSYNFKWSKSDCFNKELSLTPSTVPLDIPKLHYYDFFSMYIFQEKNKTHLRNLCFFV